MFYRNLAEQHHSRQRVSSSKLSADQICSWRRINGEITWWRDVLLHQWEVGYRCNSVKEDVLFWSRNALHQLLAAEVLFVYSRECQYSSTSSTDPSFTETPWSDHRHRTTTPWLCLNNYWVFKANLSRELSKYRQHITCPTRDSNVLDHCYTTINNAYRSVPRAALGLSDHCLVNLIPTYMHKLKSAKPVVKTVKRCTNETEQVLQVCLDLTDWSVFEAAANDLD